MGWATNPSLSSSAEIAHGYASAQTIPLVQPQRCTWPRPMATLGGAQGGLSGSGHRDRGAGGTSCRHAYKCFRQQAAHKSNTRKKTRRQESNFASHKHAGMPMCSATS
ncbi:hypothetical protein BDA96_01G562800 [Sorghum bicolor]|uniref:Uncharacterized protein n=2 Tax=Sorghum bicolor TaxID=4558 RepID=A0A921V2A7_SORBI|nr:hypothetical protein BDA96_01G562800 [Sorghum bicolor]KXG40309.1 hypothetical protein SORBI_3001G527400 [Sorghum bicolor]